MLVKRCRRCQCQTTTPPIVVVKFKEHSNQTYLLQWVTTSVRFLASLCPWCWWTISSMHALLMAHYNNSFSAWNMILIEPSWQVWKLAKVAIAIFVFVTRFWWCILWDGKWIECYFYCLNNLYLWGDFIIM